MTLHIPHISIRNFLKTRQPVQVDTPRAVDDIVQTRRGWYGRICKVGERGGYSVEVLYLTQDGSAFIRPYNARRMWVWESEIRS